MPAFHPSEGFISKKESREAPRESEQRNGLRLAGPARHLTLGPGAAAGLAEPDSCP